MAFGLVHPVALDGEHDDIGHPEDADVKERETAHEALAVEGGGVGDESAVQAAFQLGRLTFTVLEMEEQKIEKMRVILAPDSEKEAEKEKEKD